MRLEELIAEITQQENVRLPEDERFLSRKQAEQESLLVPNK